MMARVRVCIAISSCLIVSPHSAEAQERSDREIVESILRDGARARAIRAAVDVTRREQLARLDYPNPSLVYSREGAGFTEFLQVEQAVPVFGLRRRISRAGEAATAAAEAERDALLWQLRADAATAVARLLAEQDRVAVAEAGMAEMERLLEVLRVREREGEGSRFDRLRAEQELADARLAVVSARAAMAHARAAVATLMPTDSALTRVTAGQAQRPLPPVVSALVTRSTASRGEVRALQASATHAAEEAAAARVARRPSPTVTAGLKRAEVTGTDREAGGIFGISVPIPLFDKGSKQAARWQAEQSRLQIQLAFLEQSIRAEVSGAFEALSVRHQALASLPADASAEELARTAEVAYREGEIGVLELLDAARTASRARVRSIELRFETRFAEIALERAVGAVLWP